MGVDNKKETKTGTETENKNLNASGTIVVKHEMASSDVNNDFSKRYWNEQWELNDPKQYIAYTDATAVAPIPFVRRR